MKDTSLVVQGLAEIPSSGFYWAKNRASSNSTRKECLLPKPPYAGTVLVQRGWPQPVTEWRTVAIPPRLFRRFAKLKGPKAMLWFANRFGLLTAPLVDQATSLPHFAFAETIELWRKEIAQLRTCLRVWESSGGALAEAMKEVGIESSSRDLFIKASVSNSLEVHCARWEDGQLVLPTLASVIWYQFSEAVKGETEKHKRCMGCSAWITDSRRRYCTVRCANHIRQQRRRSLQSSVHDATNGGLLNE